MRIGLTLFALLLVVQVQSADRIALVIGNNSYSEKGSFPSLKNCINDARLIGETLEAVGFHVILVEDAILSEMDDALLSFEQQIEKGGTALVYFAGHGIEYQGHNYLMASNAELRARSRLSEESFKAETFASAMLLAGAKSSFLFLDCCRDVPTNSEWATRGSKKSGLAQIDVTGDIIIGFAAMPGKAALEPTDGGGNSPYAKALAKWIPSGLDHRDVLFEVMKEVHADTDGLQRPWESGSFLHPFFFSTKKAGPSFTETGNPEKPPGNQADQSQANVGFAGIAGSATVKNEKPAESDLKSEDSIQLSIGSPASPPGEIVLSGQMPAIVRNDDDSITTSIGDSNSQHQGEGDLSQDEAEISLGNRAFGETGPRPTPLLEGYPDALIWRGSGWEEKLGEEGGVLVVPRVPKAVREFMPISSFVAGEFKLGVRRAQPE